MSSKLLTVFLILTLCVSFSSAGGYKIPTFDRDFRIASCRSRCLQNEEKTITIRSLEQCMEYSTCWQCWEFCKQLEVNRIKFHVVCNNPFYCYSGCRVACSYYLEEGNLKSEANTPRYQLLIQQWDEHLTCRVAHSSIWVSPVAVYTFYLKRRDTFIMDHQTPECSAKIWSNEHLKIVITATTRDTQLAATPFTSAPTNGTVRRSALQQLSPISMATPNVIRNLGRIGPKLGKKPEIDIAKDTPTINELRAMLNYAWCLSVVNIQQSADRSNNVQVNVTWNPYPMLGIYSIQWRKRNETRSTVMHLSNNKTALLQLPVGHIIIVKVRFDNMKQSFHMESKELEVDTTNIQLQTYDGDYFKIPSVVIYASVAATSVAAVLTLGFTSWRYYANKRRWSV